MASNDERNRFWQIRDWISVRFPIFKFLKWTINEEIPGGATFFYSLGSAALFLFIILIVTGVLQLFVYVPSVDHAYESLVYLRLHVPFGWLIHGLHYWSANAFAVVVGLHMIRIFIWGAYKKPRELVWLVGLVLLLVTICFMFTGSILPWDKKGYWAGSVGLEILGSVPFIGSFLQSIFQGSMKIGQLTLSRMFVFHIVILPFLLFLMIIIHLIAFRVFGSVGPWNEEKRQKKGQFWPEQIFKDNLVALLIFSLLVGLSVFSPPPFSGMADPLDTTYIPKPIWSFLFFYQLLKYFPGKWELIGVIGIPLFIIFLLISLPFLDKTKERNPLKRPFVMICGFLFVSFILIFTILGVQSQPLNESGSTQNDVALIGSFVANSKTISKERINTKQHSDRVKSPKEKFHSTGEQAINIIGDYEGGKVIYDQYCLFCHGPKGKTDGKNFSPLLGVPSLNPIHEALFNENPTLFIHNIDHYIQHGVFNQENGPDMPPFGDNFSLTQSQIADVEAYILHLNGVRRVTITNPGIEPITFFFLFLGTLISIAFLSMGYYLITRKKCE